MKTLVRLTQIVIGLSGVLFGMVVSDIISPTIMPYVAFGTAGLNLVMTATLVLVLANYKED